MDLYVSFGLWVLAAIAMGVIFWISPRRRGTMARQELEWLRERGIVSDQEYEAELNKLPKWVGGRGPG